MRNTFQQAWNDVLTRRRVSWRRYGPHGEYRRPIIHRFDIKRGDTIADVLADNVTRSNPFFRHLCARN